MILREGFGVDLSGLPGEVCTKAVLGAADHLKRDMGFVLARTDEEGGGRIVLEYGRMERECYELRVCGEELRILAGDELGFVYGIYGVSREILGVHDFWFWNDQRFEKKDRIEVPEGFYRRSRPFAVALRGWFINDEVLISRWSVDRDPVKPWAMALEALLRCGGNMVIPGTDKNSEKYRQLASDMGLFITHHHAEPLGPPMFARVYPDLNPSYKENGKLFRGLWEQGLEEQKDLKVVWNLGFRGQGDCPFWENDPEYASDEDRGRLMGNLIEEQYQMVKRQDPEGVCCTNLYGETMELYQKGCLKLPKDVIRIWADNGFGKMVSRRQENHNPRIPSLPSETDTDGCHGIYYHVSFYDLQAANHITMLPNSPELVCSELERVMSRGAKDYWLINCSNVKPHMFYLGLISRIWRDGKADWGEYLRAYIRDYLELYGSLAEALFWSGKTRSLTEQMEWYKGLCLQGTDNYTRFVRECERVAASLPEHGEVVFRDGLLLHGQIYQYCYTGAGQFCMGYEQALAGDLKKAFYHVGKAAECYQKANEAMRAREHGKWLGFYANECLTDLKQTAWVLGGLMAWIRTLDDGPHYYLWQREFLYSEKDRRVLLILNMENHLTDEEIFQLMKERWEA